MRDIEKKPTFCRICEPLCGMVATVQDGSLTSLRPDKEHPLSSGFACQKGIAFSEVVNDPDRVTSPLRRTPDGFVEVGWEEAMSDIAARLTAVHRRHGSGAIGWYMGNPAAFSYSHLFGVLAFIKGIGRDAHYFTASTQDTSSRLLASQFLYGSPLAVPIPDLTRTDLLVVMGANPLVSHGSFLTAPRIKDRMRDIVDRGGRVIVIDPRRTETAAEFEWLGITPDGDALFLLSLLQVLFAELLGDTARVISQADGVDWLRAQCMPFTPEVTADRTGIAPARVHALARALAGTERAAVYGRLGTCVGRHGTLTAYLIDAVNLVSGKLDRPGGSVFSTLGVPGQRWAMMAVGALLRRTYRRKRTRVGGFPSVIGAEPAALMAKEIAVPGERQIKALFVSAGNPVLSVPNGDEFESAAARLELMVGLDLYINETTAHCDYVLPVTTMYERDDFAITFQQFQATPFRQATEAVVAPRGLARTEWEIIDDLMHRLTSRSPVFALFAVIRRLLGLSGRRFHPRPIIEMIIRLSDGGDRFGLRRSGLTWHRLIRRHPHGTVVAPYVETGVLKQIVAYPRGRVALVHEDIATEIAQLSGHVRPQDYPMRLIGMREPASENSWMHNAPLLLRSGKRRQRALLHLDDAAELRIGEGDTVEVRSPHGRILLPASLTGDLMRGVVAIPHGYGHKGTGGWRTANRVGGANVNLLMSTEPEDIEALAGMSRLTGIPVRVRRYDGSPDDQDERASDRTDSGRAGAAAPQEGADHL
ncbi:molybdopterin-containing oxidoreductase family protein [Nocardia gamkensis]|uniref:Molybdopterin-dependent oxidoreductase n=1 Tax=Nocardia gamkensis TaxID=352869 RepID=A0A7X6L190_9NOCA|nr:molybdopterin-dependent oxidoreductase [Nocardia gamkensis]NKY25847.1 molybdopterin-dependent oxidoreductase [Nocardia gamkensis]NQE68967.1 putative oxidoreductase YyaE [Nocardia gamkensis]